MSSAIMSTQRPNLSKILSETSRVIRDNFYHFLALSALFLCPISFAAVIYSSIFPPTSVPSHYGRLLSDVFSTSDSEVPSAGKPHLQIQLLYFLFILVLSFCSVFSITQSTFLGFYRKPVSFTSSLKSIPASFVPYHATMLISQVIMGLIFFAFAVSALLTYKGLLLLGVKMDYSSGPFAVFVIVVMVLLVGLLIYLHIEWHLMTVVVVLESQWCLAPLKRSSYLVKGMRGVVFSMILFFGFLYGVLSIWYLSLVGNANKGLSGFVVLQMVIYAGLSTVLALYSLAANSILFVYCKELHGEMGFNIDEKLGGEYAKLTFDDANIV